MPADPEALAIEAALEAERQFVLTLGGLALEIAGATLVTHEKLAVPRFNFVQEVGVGRERQSGFFERALDHYFQRAIRPTFRVPLPVPDHLDQGLRRFGFLPKTSPLSLMLASGRSAPGPGDEFAVRPAERSELDRTAAFWTSERERPEFRMALDLAWNHPNPHERLVPLLALRDGTPAASALVYRYRSSAGIHAVATAAPARGQGAASALVRYVLAQDPAGTPVRYSMFADTARLATRLTALGFETKRTFQEYVLPPEANLAFPPPGPPTPPRWRPPRTSGRPGSSG